MAIETSIHTIRHAHTHYNEEKRYAGTIDVALDEKGVKEAQEIASKIADIRLDVVITSTLRRSIDTARILASDGIPIVHSRLCNERCFGALEGLTWNDAIKLDPPVLFIEVGNDLHSVNPQGGEPFEDLWERAKKFRRFLFREYGGLRILVVSHGVFLQMFHGVLRESSCIESLAKYPSALELATFRFSDRRLIGENVTRLADIAQAQW
jgi:broad specificity phosphatase PhoE